MTTANMQYDGQLTLFDVTFSDESAKDHGYTSHEHIHQQCAIVFKRFVFQKEKANSTNYIHWQIRGSLHEKLSCSALYDQAIPHLPGHWSITSNHTRKAGNQFSYVMKDTDDTSERLAGPWTDKDIVRPPPALTRQLKIFMDRPLYHWQSEMEEYAKFYSCRKIHYIYDPHYDSGKSIFAEYLEYKGLADEVPMMGGLNQTEDIMQFVMCQPTSSCYIFDMPAAMKKDKMAQFYSAIEMLKNGFLYDKRYNGKKRRIDRPTILVFSNQLMIRNLLDDRRWFQHYITPDKQLVPYDEKIHPLHCCMDVK